METGDHGTEPAPDGLPVSHIRPQTIPRAPCGLPSGSKPYAQSKRSVCKNAAVPATSTLAHASKSCSLGSVLVCRADS